MNIAFAPDLSMVPGFLLVAVLVSFVAALICVRFRKPVLVGIAFLVTVAAIFSIPVVVAHETNTKAADRAEGIRDTYGLDVEPATTRGLQFPAEVPETPTVYGAIEVPGEGLTVQTVRLAWDGEQLILVDTDGVELPRR